MQKKTIKLTRNALNFMRTFVNAAATTAAEEGKAECEREKVMKTIYLV